MKKLHALFVAGAALLLMLSTSLLQAHTDEYLDTVKAPNGGQLRMAGALHLELVVVRDSTTAKENPVYVYLTDHAGTKIPAAGAGGTVTLLAGGRKSTLALQPDGDNRLKGTGTYASTADLKAVVAVTLKGKPAVQARFTPLAPQGDANADVHAGHH